MQHILNYLGDRSGEKWALVGKGPSFDAKVVSDYQKDGFKLCSINGTFDKCETDFDLCIFVDWPAVLEFENTHRVKAFATASEKHAWVSNHYRTLAGLTSIIPKIGKLKNISSFDVLGAEAYEDYPNIYVCHSTVEAAFDILCHAGVRDFAFIGIDGGKVYHSSFKKSRPNPNNLTGQFSGLARISRKHGIYSVQGLPKGIESGFLLDPSRGKLK